jgi:hypothetical protein
MKDDVFSRILDLASRRVAMMAGRVAAVAAALLLLAGTPGSAVASPCTDLGGAEVGGECQVSSAVSASGTFTIGIPLHILAGGKITTGAAGITLNVTGDFTMDNGGEINADNDGCSPSTNQGGPVTIAVTSGDIDIQPGASIHSNSCSGGIINISSDAQGRIDIDGLVESVGSRSGDGTGRPGGGPISVKAGCLLTISDDGKVSSRGRDPGADLVHLEGCSVVVNGLVESTAPGHVVPSNPPNSCNGATRPGKPADSTGCVEIWSGTTVVIDSTGTHSGEVNADIGVSNSPNGSGWIDIFARGNINIADGAGNDAGGVEVFAVHANSRQGNDQGGLINIRSVAGTVSATGNAIQAKDTPGGGDGGEIHVEAFGNINFDGATIDARGDAAASGGFGKGGQIGTDATHGFQPNEPIRSFNGTISWQNGSGDVRPTGTNASLPAANAGIIILQDCNAAAINTTGTLFPNNGLPATVPTELPNVPCGGAPVLPAYTAGIFPAANCTTFCVSPNNPAKRGQKFNDKNGNGAKDPGDDGLANWTIRLYDTATKALVQEVLTDASGNYEFLNLTAGQSYTVCEVAKVTWTQTFPTSVTPGSTDCAPFGADLAKWGYLVQIIADENGNDFGNHQETPDCPKFPGLTTDKTITIDPNDPTQIQDAIDSLSTGQSLLILPHLAHKTESIVIDRNVKVYGCSIVLDPPDPSQPVVTILSGANGGTTTDVHATGSAVAGYQITGLNHTVKNVRAFGNAIGFWITGNNNTVLGAQGTINNGVGFKIEGDGNVVDSATQVANSTSHGAWLTATASGNTVKKSIFTGNGGNGIFVEGTGNTVSENKAYSNVANGIRVTGDSNTLSKNGTGDINKGNVLDGILVSGNGGPLSENTSRDNGGNGFKITGSGHKLSKNVGGGTASQQNTLCEFVIGAGNQNGGSNKSNNATFSFGAAGVACQN